MYTKALSLKPNLKLKTMRYFIEIFCLSTFCICVYACTSDAPKMLSNDKVQENNFTEAALQTVQDSMQLDEAAFERISDIIIRYEAETKKVQKQQFNNPKSKQQVMQNLLKSRRAELGDVLKPKQMMTFNKMYKESLANERKRAKEERQLAPEEREALAKQLRDYRTKSVAPQIIEQRKALEAAMSSTDKAQIAGLREKMKTFNLSMKDKKNACAAIDQANKKAKMTCRRELRALQKTYDPIKKEMEELITLLKEKPGTQAVMTTMDTQRDTWRADLKKMLDKYSDKEIDVDKIPLGKYFRIAPTTTFLMLNPENINESEIETIDDEN